MSKTLIPRNHLHTTSYDLIGREKSRYQANNNSSFENNDLAELCRLCKIIQVHKWAGARRFTLTINSVKDQTSLSQLKALVRNRSVRLQQLRIRFPNGCAEKDLKDLQLEIFRYALNLRFLEMSFVGYVVRSCIVDVPDNYRGRFKDEGLIKFGKEFRRFPSSLKEIRFNFRDMLISDEGILGLSKLGRYMKSLKAATIHFEHCDQICNKGLKALAKNFFRNLAGLTQLNLRFINFPLRFRTDEELNSGIIRRYKSYGWIHGEQVYEDITVGVQQLLSSITKYLVNLKHLNLNFYGNSAFFLRNIPEKHPLSNLQSLIFNLSDCYYFKDSCLEELDTWIRKRTTNLLHLKLDFSWCYNITNQGFLKLFSGDLQHLSQLLSLELNLTGCQFITEEAVVGLFSNISEQLMNLKKLAFCSPKADKDNKITAPSLSDQSLLFVDLTNCPQITDSSLSAIELWLKSYLTQIKLQGFDFAACKQYSEQAKERDSVEQPRTKVPLRALENLTFKFAKCNQITGERIKSFLMILKSLCHLFGSIQIELNNIKILHKER